MNTYLEMYSEKSFPFGAPVSWSTGELKSWIVQEPFGCITGRNNGLYTVCISGSCWCRIAFDQRAYKHYRYYDTGVIDSISFRGDLLPHKNSNSLKFSIINTPDGFYYSPLSSDITGSVIYKKVSDTVMLVWTDCAGKTYSAGEEIYIQPKAPTTSLRYPLVNRLHYERFWQQYETYMLAYGLAGGTIEEWSTSEL